MIDRLRLNTNLFGFGGIIGRRDYLLNFVYIWAINVFFVLPYNFWLYTNIESYSDLMNLGGLFLSAPILLKVWFTLGTAFISVLTVSNVIKRLNDILGKENTVLNVLVSTLFVLSLFSIMFPTLLCMLICFLGTIASFILLFRKGEITSKYPYDVTKIFNWGAFFGTWIWGLFNKSYMPLFMLILFFTPWNFCFQLYCGLKGNEWAYKNKKWKSVQQFNKAQEKQTTFWGVFSLLIIPILYFGLAFGILAYMFSNMASDSPEEREASMQKMEKLVYDVGSSYFTTYKITENENKFYIDEDDWRYETFDGKKDILDMAARMSAIQKEKVWQKQMDEKEKLRKHYLDTNNIEEYIKLTEFVPPPSRYSELPKTKIYGDKTGQLLAEYIYDEATMGPNAKIIDVIKSSMKAYKFYNVD